MLNEELSNNLKYLSQPAYLNAVCGIVRGIERETLRVLPDGAISQQPHPLIFGSALTHPYITTDYAESLLEFITPAGSDATKTLAQLTDIHVHVVKNLGEELLWPLSMPCYIRHEDDIQLADYGQSNTGKMKHLYREGLKFRYGSYMQVISGIHFNLSFPDSLWLALAQQQGLATSSSAFQSAQYLNLIRNFKRYVWLLTYLFGASPALCSSFIGDRAKRYPFEKIGKGGLYLPNATSLRLSDLGYTSNAQSKLSISYSSLDQYVAGLRQAINTPEPSYQIPQDNPKGYRQLNDNLLQIENEFYSPIRPKRVTQSNEKPTDALANGGIEYVEFRSLDVNPFSPVGIELSQIHFLDVFACYCLLRESPLLDDAETAQVKENHDKVIIAGRDPELLLKNGDQAQSIEQWGSLIFDELAAVAKWLDQADGSAIYQQVISEQRKVLFDPNLTLSARFLNELLQDNIGSGAWAVKRAKANKQTLLNTPARLFTDAQMFEQRESSIARQQAVEDGDQQDFATFLAQYFAH